MLHFLGILDFTGFSEIGILDKICLEIQRRYLIF